MEVKEEGRSSTASKGSQSPKHESATTTTTTTAISSTSSSPSHEFSFTISLQPSSPPFLGKTKSSPSFAIDLSPADEIFFHGHLLPLHLLSHLPISPRSSTTSLECNLSTLPNKDSLEDHGQKDNNNNTKRKSKVKSFSLLFRPAKWRKQCEIGENKEEVDEEKSNKKVKFDASRILKKYLRMVKPFLFFKGKRKNCQLHRQQAHSFSSDTVMERKQERRGGVRRREFSLSAPASMKTSRTNSDSSLATVKNITSSISDSNTMEDLQSAIEAAIAHCKNSVTTKEEKLLKC